MRALRYHGYQLPSNIEDVAVPDIEPGQVLIRVAAAALNPLDVKLHSGEMQWYFNLTMPYTMGSDLSGTVTQVGSTVSKFKSGDRVIGRRLPMQGGAIAEYAAVDEGFCALLPEDMSFVEGAAIPTAAGTAWHALFDVTDLKEGQSILIHAGAGGVGSFAVQFAKMANAHVSATASGDGVEIVKKLGADIVIDYKKQNFDDVVSNVDVILDTIGFETLEKSYALVKCGGIVASIVMQPDEEKARQYEIRVARVYYSLEKDNLSNLVGYIHKNKISVLIDSVYKIESFNKALARQTSGRARGKVVLELA